MTYQNDDETRLAAQPETARAIDEFLANPESGVVRTRRPTPSPSRSLRQKLIESDGFDDHLSELRADRVLAVVVDWLRDEAEFMDTDNSGDGDESHVVVAEHLRWLACLVTVKEEDES
jgi:hypothetical protein